MPPRSSWKGYLRLSLVSVPVQAFNAAASGGGEVHFHQLHSLCHSRIRYQKVCPVHGEVSNDEIVMGYEHEKGKYVVVDDQEVKSQKGNSDRVVNIDTFVPQGAIDPVYFEGRTYYLLPDGPMGHQPYAVLVKALREQKRWAVGQATLFGREQLVMRSMDDILCLEMLHYHDQLRAPREFTGDLSLPAVKKEELRLANKLIEASTEGKFDIKAGYEDAYTNKLKKALIESKVEDREIVGARAAGEAPVINLMDALRKSVAQPRDTKRSRRRNRPRPAASRRPNAAARRVAPRSCLLKA